MTYEELYPGQRVRITTKSPRYHREGVVKQKERVVVAGKQVERVWVDTDRGRAICTPKVLEPA